MRKKVLSLLLSLTLFVSMSVPVSTKALEPVKKLDRIQAIEKLNKLSNGNLKLSEENGKVFIAGKLSDKQVAGEKSAIKFLKENKLLFGIDSISDDLKALDVETDSLGHTYVKFGQVIDGIEVDGGLLNVHFDETGVIVSVNGELNKNKSIKTLGSKEISESEAIEIAKSKYTFDSLRNTPKVERLILTQDNNNYEVFKVNISYKEPTIGNYDVFIETSSGEVIKTENNIRFDGPTTGTGIDVLGNVKNLNLYQSGTEYQTKDLTKEATSSIDTYTMNNGTIFGYLVSNDTNSFNTEDHKASVSAHYNAGKVIDFYKNLFNRNSLDNNGMVVDSYTHYGSNYNNAFWTGYEMVYGDGDGTTFTYLSGDLDVVGHEMTHGVIEHTANLYYHNQSGALNESMADIFGVLIATYDKYNVASGGAWTFNTADWVIGDDIYTPSIPGDALRSLSEPTLYDQPEYMANYVNLPDTEAGDWGGVHINSGIPNKAAYSVAESIGMEKTAKIYYRALVNYMSEYTDFEDAKKCIVQAATDLYGGSSAEVTAVNNAFDLVGIGQPLIDDPYEPNDTLDTAYAINLGEIYESYISSYYDMDYYKFNVSNTGNINIALTNLPEDYDLILFNSSGTLLDVSFSWGTESEIINYNVTETGDYYILVIPYDGYSTSQKYSLTVTKAAEGVSLNKTSASLNVGGTTALAATVSPQDATNKNVTWQSSNTSVATVDSSGKVTAVGNGTATITVTTEDGGFKATCSVTVAVAAGPTSVKAVSSSYNSIKTSWAAVTGASGYEVYRAESSTGSYTKVSTVTGTSYNNTGLTTNKTYYYKVRSYNTVGTTKVYSNFSSVVSAKPIPAVPGSVKAASSSYNSVKTTWTAVTGASGYEVYRATSKTGTYSKVSTTTATSYNNTGLTTNTTYYYKVRAYRTVGTTKVYSSFSSVVSAKPIPAIPGSVKAASSSYNSVKTTWTAVTGASGYEVYRATSSTGTYSKVSTTTATSYNNTGLTTNKTYYYKVRAYRTVGTTKVYSSFSSVVNAKPIPSVPALVNARSSSYNSIKTSWVAVTGASGYEVYRATSSSGSYTKVATVTGTSYNNTGLTTNKTYYYKVRAYRTVGTTKVYSHFSSVVNAKPIPATVTNLKAARASSTSIKTTWSKVTGASGYQVYRSTSKTGTYSSVGTTTNLYYTNSKLTTGRTYYYKVRAYRTVGTTKVYGNWSSIVYAKP